VVKGHSHWVWNVEYNKFRDQLVLSSSTDSSVNLWKIATLSSEPLGIDDYRDDSSDPSAYVVKAPRPSVHPSVSSCHVGVVAHVSTCVRVCVRACVRCVAERGRTT
jgi:hypothetical protein